MTYVRCHFSEAPVEPHGTNCHEWETDPWVIHGPALQQNGETDVQLMGQPYEAITDDSWPTHGKTMTDPCVAHDPVLWTHGRLMGRHFEPRVTRGRPMGQRHKPMGDSWETHGWPMGGPWVVHGPPLKVHE